MSDKKKMTIQKIKNNIIYYLLAVVIAAAFFAHETIVPTDENIELLRSEWKSTKIKNKVALNTVKNLAIGTPEYDEYIKINTLNKEAYEKLKVAKENASFLGFQSFRLFLGEFGWAFGLLIYAIFNIATTLRRKGATYFGELALHSTLIFIALFYVRWCFMTTDYGTITYITVNLLCSVGLILAMYWFVTYKNKAYQITIDFLYKIRNYHYKTVATKASIAEMHSNPADGIPVEKQIKAFETEFDNTLQKVV